MNETICTIMKRGSLRRYKEENISDEHLDIILNAAMRAPTAGNMMTYSIITVRKEETKKKLAISCDNQPFIAKAPLILIFLADYSKWYKYYEVNGVREFQKDRGETFAGPSAGSFVLAVQDAVIAAENAVKGKSETVNYKSIPSCVYTEPEVAGVGKTEDELKAEGTPYKVGRFDFRGLGKAKAIGKLQGFIKVLTDEDDVIIGATLVGPHCTDLLTELSLAVGLGLKAKDVGKVIHAHPSLSEGIMEALHDVHGECVHSVPSTL